MVAVTVPMHHPSSVADLGGDPGVRANPFLDPILIIIRKVSVADLRGKGVRLHPPLSASNAFLRTQLLTVVEWDLGGKGAKYAQFHVTIQDLYHPARSRCAP